MNLLHHVKITPQMPSDSLPDLPGNLKEETSSSGQVPKSTVKTHLFKKRTAIKSEDQNIDIKPITPIAQPIRDQTIATNALPLTSTVSKNPAGRLSDTSRNFGSPIPCGDSFFEDDAVLTQTHKDFMSKFKRVSLPGSNNSGNSNFSSPTVNFTTSPIIKGQNAYQQSLDQSSNPSAMYGQKKSTVLNQSDSFISPNRYKPNNATGKGNSHFDNIDDEMNLELAEQSDFDFDYKISSAALPAAKKSTEKGDFSSNSVHKGDNYGGMGGNYDLDQSGQDMFSIDDFGDEDFAEVLDYDDNLPAISHNSRASTGSTGNDHQQRYK